MPPTNVLTADREKILAEIATPAKGGSMVGVQGVSPVGQASPGKLGAGASLKDFELLEKLPSKIASASCCSAQLQPTTKEEVDRSSNWGLVNPARQSATLNRPGAMGAQVETRLHLEPKWLRLPLAAACCCLLLLLLLAAGILWTNHVC